MRRNSSLTIVALFYHALCVKHNTFEERSCCKRLQWSNHYSFCFVTIPNPVSSQFVYNSTSIFGLMLNTVSRYPFPSPHTCQYRNRCYKIVLDLQHSQLSVLQLREAYNECFFMFDFRSDTLQLVELVTDRPKSPEFFIFGRCIRLSIFRMFFDSMATVIQILIFIRAVCKQLHCFCNNTVVGILVALTTSMDSGLQKVFKTFHRSGVNEAMKLCAYEHQLQVI